MSDDDFTPWTSDGAARVRTAAAEFSAAIVAHAEVVASASSDADVPRIFAASDRLLPVALAYADAHFEHTGTGSPFGILAELDDDGADDDESESDEPVTGVSVLQRRDYRVVDEAAVIAAGRQAYLRVWPDDDEAAAAADVTDLGRALYQLAHADGWHSLDQVEGLRVTAGAVAVFEQDELLRGDPDDWPDDVFEPEGELLYSQADVFVD
ncbi:hypothetical protein [Angustibacter sp. Root456]|uniref:hypothetical protein n=1 Tax=Angustibacter sp. Root456 TaxID=1736539 RepID=UPI0006F6C37F|nr:hypothetical protein [Angustibacter sp. Root456]KQX69589.1 hypothetical protein ASD06_00550 [Angustibacter sp. Root456]